MPRNHFRIQPIASVRGSLVSDSLHRAGAVVMQPPNLEPSRRHVYPLPGSRAELPNGMSDYLIALKATSAEVDQPSRSDIFGANLSLTTTFRRNLETWLGEHHLDRQVAGIGEVNGFPVISLTCTAQVAQRIPEIPGVEWIMPDDNHAMRLQREF